MNGAIHNLEFATALISHFGLIIVRQTSTSAVSTSSLKAQLPFLPGGLYVCSFICGVGVQSKISVR